MPERIGDVVAPPATFDTSGPKSAVTGDVRTYLDQLNPFLAVVIGEGRQLSELGQARSRNIIELGVRMDRFREASAELQSFIGANAPPPGLGATVDELSVQLLLAEDAIQASIQAIQGFDWDALGISVDEFSSAVSAIEAISGRLYT